MLLQTPRFSASLGKEASFILTPLEKEMAAHSSVLAWRIPGMTEPVGLPSMVYGVAQSRTRLKQLSSSSSSEPEMCCFHSTNSRDACNLMLNPP